jgi:hypothetical protein
MEEIRDTEGGARGEMASLGKSSLISGAMKLGGYSSQRCLGDIRDLSRIFGMIAVSQTLVEVCGRSSPLPLARW